MWKAAPTAVQSPAEQPKPEKQKTIAQAGSSAWQYRAAEPLYTTNTQRLSTHAQQDQRSKQERARRRAQAQARAMYQAGVADEEEYQRVRSI